jgi:protein ImuB
MAINRIVSVCLPWWSAQRVLRALNRQQGPIQPWDRRRIKAPVLLVTRTHGVDRVTHHCPLGSRVGIQPGITLAHAQSLLGPVPVVVRPYSPTQELAALDRLARAASRFSPTITPDGTDGLLLDITGCARIFKGEHRLLNQLAQWLSKHGFTVRLGVAPSPSAAWALARYGRRTRRGAALHCWPSADLTTLDDALAPLPVAALRLTPESILKLHTVGVKRVDELLAMPKPDLLDRLGQEEVQKINRALGLEQELLVPHRPQEPVVFEQLFDGPCPQIQAVQAATTLLIQRACAWLHSRESGVTRLSWSLERSDLPELSREASFSRPTRDARHIGSVLHPTVETAHLGWGALAVRLHIHSHQKLIHKQAHAWDTPQAPSLSTDESLGVLLDQWIGRFGADHVLKPTLRATHTPERKTGFVHASQPHPVFTIGPKRRQTTLMVPWALFDPPEAIQVDLPADDEYASPTRLLWGGQWLDVNGHASPQRVTPEWWKEPVETQPGTRDYHRLLTSIGWVWVYEDLSSSQWFIHGVWA